MMGPLLGCVADDITGATDLAGALSDVGWRTVLVLGAPSLDTPVTQDCDAVVVALKSRTQPALEAAADTVAAVEWLMAQGISRFYLKYCSTFDSTAEGNIGPVADAVLECTKARQVVHAPSYPGNGRTVYQGHLFVGTALLSESGMERHPLTPMTDANLVRVLQSQTPLPVSLLPLSVVADGEAAIEQLLDQAESEAPGHVIADAVTVDDLDRIASAAARHTVLGGGAAFGASWARALGADGTPSPVSMGAFAAGPAVVLVGSASKATSGQVAAFGAHHPVHRLSLDDLADPEVAAQRLTSWAMSQVENGPVMVCADTSPSGIETAREHFGRQGASERVEATLAGAACHLYRQGIRRIVVAGGETSGAVAAALGIRSVEIGASIATGVPWTLSHSPDVAIAFKSGNFGGEHFFTEALSMLGRQETTC